MLPLGLFFTQHVSPINFIVMKNSILVVVVCCFSLLVGMEYAFAGSAAPQAPVATQTLSKKALKKQQKMEKRMARLEKFIQKRAEKASKPGKKHALDPLLKQALIYWVVSILVGIVAGIFTGLLGFTGVGLILGLLLYLAALAIFVLAIIKFLQWLSNQ